MATLLDVAKAIYTQLNPVDQKNLSDFITDFQAKQDYQKKELRESFGTKYMLSPSGITSGGKCALCGK